MFDTIIITLITAFGIRGFIRGLIWEIFRILGIIVGFLFSFQMYSYFSSILKFFGFSEISAKPLGYVFAFAFVYLLIIIASKILSKFFKALHIGWADKLGGLVFGSLKAAIIISLILSMLVSVAPHSQMAKNIKESYFSSKVLKLTPYVFEVINNIPKNKKENPFKSGKQNNQKV